MQKYFGLIFLVSAATAAAAATTTKSFQAPAPARLSNRTKTIGSIGGDSDFDVEDKENGIQNSVHTDNENLHELDTWQAPDNMRKAYVYYQAGYDEENRPVWAAEAGKWNFRLVTDGGQAAEKTFDKFLQQLAHRAIKSINEISTEDEPVDGVIVILDMEGFDIVKMSHLPTVSLLLRMLIKFLNIVDTYLHSVLVINTSAAAQGLFNLARPILGPIFQRAEIFGTNRAKWVPQLLKHVPKKSLPSWYGGKSDFKPLKIYG